LRKKAESKESENRTSIAGTVKSQNSRDRGESRKVIKDEKSFITRWIEEIPISVGVTNVESYL
jgi:hypothetical protein